MAAAETARLIASLELQDKNFTRGIKRVEAGVNRVDKKLGAFSGFVNRNMARAIDSIGVRLVSSVGQGLEEMATLEDATASVTGAITQVGKGWTTTGADIAAAANEIEAATDAAFDDKAIVAATATLIRYGNVSEDNLRPAMEVMTDLAAKTGDVESAGSKLAKALADPTKATRVLREAGVRLTKAEDKRLKQLVESNRLGEAQALVLKLVGERTKGAAKAAGGPYRDALNKLGDAGEDLRRALVTGIAPALIEVADLLTNELAKPETIAFLKDVGKNLGTGLKGVVSTLKGINWGAIAGFLGKAADFAGQLVNWFQKMPDWAQAFLVGGFVATRLPVIGDLISSLASGLIKGVLGINAGVVNVNAASVAGAGGLGGAGGAPAAAGKLGKVMSAVRILGAVTIAGASLVALAETFQGFLKSNEENQQALQEKVNRTQTQNFQETIANLKATSAGIQKMNLFEQGIAAIWSGGQITQDFEMAADRITHEQNLSRQQTVDALNSLKSAQETARDLNLKTPKLDAAVNSLTAQLRKMPTADPKDTSPARLAGDRPSPGNPGVVKAQLEAAVKIGTQPTANAVKNAQSIASREASAQKTELGNIKNATATMTTQQATQAASQLTATNTGTQSAAVDATNQRLATANGTAATRIAGVNTAAATRGVAPPITSAVYAIGSAITSTIWAARPVIQPTTIINKYSQNERGGTTSGSRTRRPS